MPNMLEDLQLKLDGRHHSGIDDCRNIAKIVERLAKLGHTFKITKTILWENVFIIMHISLTVEVQLLYFNLENKINKIEKKTTNCHSFFLFSSYKYI